MTEFNLIQQSEHCYSLEGELTFTSLNKKTIKNMLCLNPEKVTNIDLTNVNLADSAGLALMIEWIKHSKLCDSKLKFKNIPQQLLTLAAISGLDLSEYFD